MADYWKSQPRKFCEFCKCWLTDNKPSIEFHEKGKRHQENVQKRIDTIKKKSLSESKKKKEMENDMDSLNKAALEAFKKDIMNDPSLAKQYGITIAKKESALDSAADSKIPVKEEATESNADNKNDDDGDGDADVKKEECEIEAKQTDWYEAVSDEGYHYFWNTTTNESVWEKPECYYSLQEQGLNEDGTEIKTETTTENNEETDFKETKESVDEETDKQEPEEQDVKTETPSPPPSPPPQPKITSSRSAYGQWTTCVKTESIDYELPSVPSEMPLPTFSSEEPVKMKFKEKTLTLPDIPNGETVTFKKRKISKGSRNIRSKIEDD